MSNMHKNIKIETSNKWKDTAAEFPYIGFRCGFSQGKAKMIRRTSKDEDGTKEGFVISWMIQGELQCESPEGNYHLSEPCVSIRRPGHQYTFTFPEEKEHLRYYLIMPETFYKLLIQIHPALDMIPPVRILLYCETLKQQFRTLIDRMLRISQPQIIDLIPDMVSLILNLTGIDIEKEEPPMIKVRRLLEQINGFGNLKEIALVCDLSYSHFRRKFTETYGISPSKYRIQCRIREAKQILIEGYSIKEAAHYLSYPDSYTFAHQFKSITGMSPGEYKRKYAEF